MIKHITAGTAVLLAVALSVTACGDKANEPFRDAPRSGNDSGAAITVEMPDGFSNVATKCIQGTDVRITVAYHGNHTYGAISTIVDPSCKGA